jgi:hypothetical protein
MERMPETRTEAVEIFEKWIAQKPGLDPRNYFSEWSDQNGRRAYRQEQESIRKDRGKAIDALRTFEGLPYDAEVLRDAMRHAFSGRLQFNDAGELDYTTGQYWPTEYRSAAATVLEQYISDMRRKGIGIPADAVVPHGQTITVEQLRAISKGHGGHFFDAGSMRFFGSKVHGPVYTGADGWYFVTSEQREETARRGYTVRKMDKEGDISEPEGHEMGFQRYDTARDALKVAQVYATQSVRLAAAIKAEKE